MGEGERRLNLLRLFLLLPHSHCTVLSALAWMPPQLQGEGSIYIHQQTKLLLLHLDPYSAEMASYNIA